ncbi:MAG: DUF4388 domain-containing protein [Thermoanaerobaculaceae bacterium]|nr:DUF4388 domain-containing protein [Thermoanaerobaculaceae bacterium]
MKAILGRLSELGLREISKLLTAAGAEGVLEVDGPGGVARVAFRNGHLAGEASAALLTAYATRNGTYCFRPGGTGPVLEWLPQEEFFARLDADARTTKAGSPTRSDVTRGTEPSAAGDPLAELRDSLAQIPIPGGAARVLVAAADPRPYRTLIPQWRQRGWDVVLDDAPRWPEGPAPRLVVEHLPMTATLAGQDTSWLALARRAVSRRPPVPVLWVGGLSDPWLRHEAIVAGVEFMLPAPAGDAGEAARWFRDDLTLLADRILSRRGETGVGEAEAFRDFFLALQVDADPAEVRASLLRFAGTFFARGALLEIRDAVFESVGGYGFALTSPVRISRGLAALEEVVVERHGVRLDARSDEASSAVARAVAARDGLDRAEVLPVLAGGDCTALFLGDRPLVEAGGTEALAGVLARSGALIGLTPVK